MPQTIAAPEAGSGSSALPLRGDLPEAGIPQLSIPMLQHRQIGFGEKIKFRLGVTLEQLVYQTLFPLSLPLVLAVRGRAAAENMRFLPTSWSMGTMFPFAFTVVMAANFWVPLICWIAGRGGVLGGVFDVEIAVVIFATLFQRLAIATKYAYMPPDRYTLFMTSRATNKQLAEEQLITGWLTMPADMLRRETQEAMRRLGFATDCAFFELEQDHLPALLKHLGIDGTVEEGAVYSFHSERKQMPLVRVRASWVAQQLLRLGHAGGRPTQRRLRWINWALAFIFGFAALVVRCSYDLPIIGSSASEGVATVMAIGTVLGFTYVVLAYQRTALCDYHMRASALRRVLPLFSPVFDEGRVMCRTSLARGVSLGSLAPAQPSHRRSSASSSISVSVAGEGDGSRASQRLSVSSSRPAQQEGAEEATGKLPDAVDDATGLGDDAQEVEDWETDDPCPRLLPHSLSEPIAAPIPLTCPNNAVAFLVLRRVITSFGVRYFKRIQAYQSYSVILVIAVVVGLLVNVGVSGVKVTGVSPTQSAASTASSTLFAVQTLFTGTALGLYVSACLYYGARANTLVLDHTALLEARRLELEAQAASCPPPTSAVPACENDRRRASSLAAASVLSSVIACMKSDSALEPICIVGLPASFGMAQTVFTALVSAVIAGAKLVFN